MPIIKVIMAKCLYFMLLSPIQFILHSLYTSFYKIINTIIIILGKLLHNIKIYNNLFCCSFHFLRVKNNLKQRLKHPSFRLV